MEGDEYLENNVLLKILLDSDKVTIFTLKKSYELDISVVDKKDLKEMETIIRKLNFDSSFKVSNA